MRTAWTQFWAARNGEPFLCGQGRYCQEERIVAGFVVKESKATGKQPLNVI